jgi:hypothetical protein
MSWRITPTYTPNYPTSPTNGQTYTDPIPASSGFTAQAPALGRCSLKPGSCSG